MTTTQLRAIGLAVEQEEMAPLDRFYLYVENGGEPGPPMEITRWLNEQAKLLHRTRQEPTPIYDALVAETQARDSLTADEWQLAQEALRKSGDSR